jgi:uncharacterized metal-binding protein
MPDGATHFACGLFVIAAGVGGTWVLTGDGAMTAAVALGCGVGLTVTPDADVAGSTYPEKMLKKIPVAGWLWAQSWSGYGALAKHRGISHNVIFGTATRVAWLLLISFFWLAVASGVAAWYGGDVTRWPAVLAETLVWLLRPGVLLGMWLQDFCHVALDWLF